MRVQRRLPGSGVLSLGEESFQFRVLGRPVFLTGVKYVCKTAPANILRKYLLLLVSSTAMFLLQRKQSANSCNVAGILLLRATDTKVIVRDAEIPGRFRCIFFKLL